MNVSVVYRFITTVGAVTLPISAVQADHHHTPGNHHYDEEIVVSAPFQKNAAETALPINVLSGESLRQTLGNTLGDSLGHMPGIQNASFGTGVGRPVIRGQSGNRVQILQNSVSNVDVSAVSQDHANGVEAQLAERIEVIRGPATLLYGNGAVGGIVNVIDGRIPTRMFDHPEIFLQQSHNANSDENNTLGKFNASVGNFSIHLDGFTRKSNNTEISGFAALPEADEDEHEGEHEDEHEEEHEDEAHDHDDEGEEARRGVIENSDTDARGVSAGFSWVSEAGFLGFSFNRLDNNYGLPPGVHGHHDEEHDDDDHAGDDPMHDEEEHDDHSEEEATIRIDLAQKRYDLKGAWTFERGFVKSVSGHVNVTEYEHEELEIEDGIAEVGTRFENEGYEARFEIGHTPVLGWEGNWGVQMGDTTFSAIGEESFIPETDTQSVALFAVEQQTYGDWTWELGARVERLELDSGAACSHNETTVSLSASLQRPLNDSTNLLAALSRSERAPTLEERYSNINDTTCQVQAASNLVEHAATGLLEIGNPELDPEVSSNLEFGLRKYGDRWEAEINVYYNAIDDYIYLQGDSTDDDIAVWAASDAVFYGFESELRYPLAIRASTQLDLRLMADLVRARFDDPVLGSRNIPRIPPARLGAGFRYSGGNWTISADVTEAFEQNDTATGETDTQGYTSVDLYADYHMDFGNAELLFYANADNLLDEEIRSHASFLKDVAPEAGRSIRFGVRFSY